VSDWKNNLIANWPAVARRVDVSALLAHPMVRPDGEAVWSVDARWDRPDTLVLSLDVPITRGRDIHACAWTGTDRDLTESEQRLRAEKVVADVIAFLDGGVE